MLKNVLGNSIDTLHFDEAGCRMPPFTISIATCTPSARMAAFKDAPIFATHSTHKLLAGISQASQILVQDSETRKLDRHMFNEAYLMHTSTSPDAIIASCDVAAAMMDRPEEPRGATVHPRSDRFSPCHA
jgi:arginine decarboxylase